MEETSISSTYPCSQPLTCSSDNNNLAMLRERGLGGIDGRVDVAMNIRHELVSFDKVVGRKVLHCFCWLYFKEITVMVEVV
jgi:hypothetical protein